MYEDRPVEGGKKRKLVGGSGRGGEVGFGWRERKGGVWEMGGLGESGRKKERKKRGGKREEGRG